MNTAFYQNGAYPCGAVLIVDDEENNRMLLRDPLEAQGHAVTEASSGQQALNLLSAKLPDVVLLDVMMPQLDGFEVCRRIKANAEWAHVPVLLVTALTERKERLTGIQVGANDFITKPVDVTDVVLRVRNAVQLKRLFDTAKESASLAGEMKALQQKLTHMIIREMRGPLVRQLEMLRSLKQKNSGQWTKKDTQMAEDAWQIANETSLRIEKLIEMGRVADKEGTKIVALSKPQKAAA
jgi:two-component system sensor histidine kinase/response regulator